MSYTWPSKEGLKNYAYGDNPYWTFPGNYAKPKEPENEYWFIYGTLKRGHRNHEFLVPKHMSLVDARAYITTYRLVEISKGIPAIVYYPNGVVYGEIWRMDAVNVKLMEVMEQGYTKKLIPVNVNYSTITCHAWILESSASSNMLNITNWTLEQEQGLLS